MPLRQLQLQHSYRTSRGDMVKDFFVPCLEQAILYRRAAGCFTSHGLALAAKGVASLVSRGGQMRLVVSPHLEPDDIAALQGAMDQPQDLLRSITSKSQAGAELLAALRDPANPPPGLPPHLLNDLPDAGEFRPPRGFELRDYQTAAGREWSRRGGKGILAMATGSGKTLTALVLASRVAEKNSPLVLIVTCPFIKLCKQWLPDLGMGFLLRSGSMSSKSIFVALS